MRKSAPSRFGSARARPPHAEAGQRIGLLGGSFNPPHAAHRMVSQTALKRLGLDQVWWIVTPGNPLKARRPVMPLERRLELCRDVADDARIVVTGFEAELKTAFTAATLGFLVNRFPTTRFVWIMGADCLPEFHRWGQWREIFRLLPIAVVDRPGWHLPALSSRAAAAFAKARLPEARAATLVDTQPPAWLFLTGRLTELSSTAIRARNGPAVAERTRQKPAGRRKSAPGKVER